MNNSYKNSDKYEYINIFWTKKRSPNYFLGIYFGLFVFYEIQIEIVLNQDTVISLIITHLRREKNKRMQITHHLIRHKISNPITFTFCQLPILPADFILCRLSLWPMTSETWRLIGWRTWKGMDGKGKRSSSHSDTVIRRWPIKCQLTRPN